MMFIETDEGKLIADALVILNGSLHRMSAEGTGKFKWVPYAEDEYRMPHDFVRRSMTHLLERFRRAMNIESFEMYQQYGKAKEAKGAR